MMSCNGIYVESIETLMGQIRKRRLLAFQRSDERTCAGRIHYLSLITQRRPNYYSQGIFRTLWTLLRYFKGFKSLKFSQPLVYPSSPHNLLPLHWQSQGHSSSLVMVFSIEVPPPWSREDSPIHFRLLVTMSHEDLIKTVMSVIHGTYTPCTYATRYHVTNRNILQVATTLKSII